ARALHRRTGTRRGGDRPAQPTEAADLQPARGPLGRHRACRPRRGRPARGPPRGAEVALPVAARIDALYLRTIQLVLVAIVLNLAFASSINDSFLLLGRGFRFLLLFELAVLAGAYRAWRRPRRRVEGLAYVAVGAFATLAVVSAAWSARPEHTEKRALGFLILVLAGAALADATVGRPEAVR